MAKVAASDYGDLIKRKYEQVYGEHAAATDPFSHAHGAGLLLAEFLNRDPEFILRAAIAALTDANYHTEAAMIEGIIATLPGVEDAEDGSMSEIEIAESLTKDQILYFDMDAYAAWYEDYAGQALTKSVKKAFNWFYSGEYKLYPQSGVHLLLKCGDHRIYVPLSLISTEPLEIQQHLPADVWEDYAKHLVTGERVILNRDDYVKWCEDQSVPVTIRKEDTCKIDVLSRITRWKGEVCALVEYQGVMHEGSTTVPVRFLIKAADTNPRIEPFPYEKIEGTFGSIGVASSLKKGDALWVDIDSFRKWQRRTGQRVDVFFVNKNCSFITYRVENHIVWLELADPFGNLVTVPGIFCKRIHGA